MDGRDGLGGVILRLGIVVAGSLRRRALEVECETDAEWPLAGPARHGPGQTLAGGSAPEDGVEDGLHGSKSNLRGGDIEVRAGSETGQRIHIDEIDAAAVCDPEVDATEVAHTQCVEGDAGMSQHRGLDRGGELRGHPRRHIPGVMVLEIVVVEEVAAALRDSRRILVFAHR